MEKSSAEIQGFLVPLRITYIKSLEDNKMDPENRFCCAFEPRHVRIRITKNGIRLLFEIQTPTRGTNMIRVLGC